MGGVWALIEKSQLITQNFDKLAPGQLTAPALILGFPWEPVVPFPSLAQEGTCLAQVPPAPFPVPSLPTPTHVLGGFAQAGLLGQTAAHRWLASAPRLLLLPFLAWGYFITEE